MIDLTNEEAYQWFKNVIRDQVVANGFMGWMADFGEGLPFDAKLSSGISAATFHNVYPEYFVRLNQEVLQETGLEGQAAVFMRSGNARTPGYAPLFWLGDQMTSWDKHDGLKSSITGLLSGGISGFSINHSDIGGLIALKKSWNGIQHVSIRRTEELFKRWTEMNAFTSVFRTHEGNNPNKSHQFYSSYSSVNFFAYFAKVFASLAEYRDGLFIEAEEHGIPVARHLWLEFPNDPLVRTIHYQFMLGSELLVAPVTEPNQTKKRVYLPALSSSDEYGGGASSSSSSSSWIHLWSGKKYGQKNTGSWVTVDAPLGEPPVFFKESSLLGCEIKDKISRISRETDRKKKRKNNKKNSNNDDGDDGGDDDGAGSLLVATTTRKLKPKKSGSSTKAPKSTKAPSWKKTKSPSSPKSIKKSKSVGLYP